MKRIALFSTTLVFVAALAVSLAAAQNAPLGDYARQVRKQKGQQAPAAKKFDNDNLPAEDKLSVVGQPPPAPATDTSAASAANNDGAPPAANQPAAPVTSDSTAPTQPPASTAADQKPPEDERAQKQQMFQGWKKRIDDQKGQLDMLARELDVQNREYRLRAASFYADAGNRLRNSAAWDKEDTQYKDQIAAKQKQLEDAKKQLEDMQEEARKAGVPSSMRE